MHVNQKLLWGAFAASSLLLAVSSAASAESGKTVRKAPETALEDVLVALDAPTTLPQEGALPLSGPVQRHRTVAVRTELLADAAAGGGDVALEPFPGERYQLRAARAEAAWGEGQVYWGRLFDERGAEVGSAAVSVVADAVAASLRLDDRLLRIEPAGNGAHRVVEIDEFRMPTCGTTHEHILPPPAPLEAPEQTGGGSSKAAGFTNLPTVDVLVAYTPQARAGQGGTNGMNALINLAISESNNGYNNSDVNQRYRLVHAYETVGYTESTSFSTNLNRFRSTTDGYMDEVHGLRNQYGADACCLILNGSQYCGVAYGVMGFPSQSWNVNAFQVTARTCATGYYSFSHEFGHLFGSHHDKANAGNAYYPYGYGWRTASGQWRTVMAYAPGTRINYFSNPSKTYGGQSLGLANQAENYRSLNNNAPVTSQWRCAVPQNYCQAKFTSGLSYPTLGWVGKPVANGSGNFQVLIQDAEPNKASIVFYGPAAASSPFMGGTLCVGSPIVRLPMQVTDGSGNATFPFPVTQFDAGDEVYMQGWFRDPAQLDGTGVGLTDGLLVDVCHYNL